MIFQRKLLATLLVGSSLGLNAASAGAVTSTLQYLNPAVSGGVGSLSVAPYLPQGASFTSGTLDFSFSGLAGAPSYVSTTTTSNVWASSAQVQVGSSSYTYCCGMSRCTGYSPIWGTNNYYTNTSTSYYTTPAESATVTVGGAAATAVAPSTVASVSRGSTANVLLGQNASGGWDYLTTNLYDNTTTIGGSFNATLALNPTALGVLNNTGLIGFGLQTVGNVTLNRVAFTGNYTLAPVPEPETYAMLLAGLGLLGFTVRRRKQSA